ncbi:hypothetical protein [Pseudomonas sp. LFM046]|uniref:hypothetical protein n=1 Tax=Pseudomonas sp. LFM046 TaxID=1608357 RepID=UPI0011AEE103|nr:hypothetical protein [Pseudomonas sp. LFM046]
MGSNPAGCAIYRKGPRSSPGAFVFPAPAGQWGGNPYSSNPSKLCSNVDLSTASLAAKQYSSRSWLQHICIESFYGGFDQHSQLPRIDIIEVLRCGGSGSSANSSIDICSVK